MRGLAAFEQQVRVALGHIGMETIVGAHEPAAAEAVTCAARCIGAVVGEAGHACLPTSVVSFARSGAESHFLLRMTDTTQLPR